MIAAISVGLSIGIAGTYQLALSSTPSSPPPSVTAHSTMSLTSGLHAPQPLPARVAFMQPETL